MSRKLTDWIESYLDYSGQSEAPDKFHFWTAISVIAGALRRRVWIDQGYFQWTPNFYIVFVAPPGIVSKSTTANIGMRLLKQLGDIKFGPDAVTWQALTQSLAGATEEALLPNGEYTPMSCITIVSSEFGTFLNPSDREMVDVMVSLWDGQLGTWEKATKTQGSDLIVNPWINLLACTTPSWIAGNFPEYMIGGGFTSRCVFVYAEEKRHLVAYPGGALPADFQQKAEALVHDLEIISQMIGEYTIAPDALEWGEEWYKKHYDDRNANKALDDTKFGGYKARKQTHIHKLAMILAASRHDELVIKLKDLQDAAGVVTELEKDMPKVFALIGRTDEARVAETVYAIVHKYGAIDRELLFRELFHTLGGMDTQSGIQAATAAGLIKIVMKADRVILVDTHLKDSDTSLANGIERRA